jgi:hypothetical protein
LLGSGRFDYVSCFVGELLANVVRGPFIQNTTARSTQVAWKTLSRSAAAVEFGTNEVNIQRIEVDLSETNHLATLTNLRPDTRYLYRIVNRFGDRETYSDWNSFRTFKLTGPVTFHVVGDSGWATSPQFQIAEQMERSEADLLFHVGDLAYYAFNYFNADLRCFSIYWNQMRSAPWFLALGNHDSYADREAALQSFYLPTNSVTGTEHFYSFDHGDVHFVALWADLQGGADYKPGSPQYTWLERDLAATTKPWKFMFFHHTWRSSSIHGVGDDYDVNLVPDSVQLDSSFGELARRYGVQIVFNGHDHCYERLAPSGGPISFVTGGGGANLYGLSRLHPDSIQFTPRYHFLRVAVDGDEARVEAVGHDGLVFDTTHLRRTFPERQVVSASWNSPVIESKAAGDTNANILGQVFNLTGSPISGPMGRFTSAGRLFVNNDKQNLYLGLDEVMLRAGEELFMFLEVPGIPGVNSLRDIGNGLVDPVGKVLTVSTSFPIFPLTLSSLPSALCLAMSSATHHRAPLSEPASPSAQAREPFYLTNGMPELAGQRLAQFNLSPQIFTAPYEQNADFIELAIPYTALGDLKPGAMIRVGVVTALRGIDTNVATQTRQLDSNGIGYSVRTNPTGTFLEGITVRLADDPDPDSDGLTTAQEIQLGTNPNNSDSDADGLNDGWEVKFGFNPLGGPPGEGSADPDGDSLTNLQESQAGTDPFKADTDNDTLPDAWELAFGLNPLRAVASDGPAGDPDADGLSNSTEFRAGTIPTDPQSKFDLRGISVDNVTLRLVWSAVAGKKYKLQYRDSFAEPFRDVEHPAFPMTAQAMSESFSVNFAPELPPRTRYYRVQLVE